MTQMLLDLSGDENAGAGAGAGARAVVASAAADSMSSVMGMASMMGMGIGMGSGDLDVDGGGQEDPIEIDFSDGGADAFSDGDIDLGNIEGTTQDTGEILGLSVS